MRRLALLALIPAALVAASPAAGAERTISTDQTYAPLAAYGKTIVWSKFGGGNMVWHAGAISVFPQARATEIELGSGADGRTATIFTRCEDTVHSSEPKDCVVRQGKVSSPRGTRVLFRREGQRFRLPEGDLYRGNVAIADGADAGPTRIYVRPRGAHGLRRVAKRYNANDVSIGANHVAFEQSISGGRALTTIDWETMREEQVAVDDNYDNDCKCTSQVSSASHPVIAGPFVYWLETEVTANSFFTQIGRARLGEPNAPVDFYVTAARAITFAIRGSRIVYAVGDGGIVEVTDPDWRPAGFKIPSSN